MELFSEIYSCYFNITEKLLSRISLSKPDIESLVQNCGFSESALYLMPKLTHKNGWKLLEQKGDLFFSSLKSVPEKPLSALELSWLKALLSDPRFCLFFTDTELERLTGYLKDISPLFSRETFYAFDQFSDGDNYSDVGYRERFLLLLRAIKNHTPIKITYRNKESLSRQCHCVPLKLEYSEKDDKFRVYVGKISKNRKTQYSTINVGRITAIHLSGEQVSHDFQAEEYLHEVKCKEPVVIEITNERKAIERVMIEFSSYEKRSEYDESTGICTSEIYYNKNDETELLIRLLGFGPVLKVLSPQHFVDLMKERVKAQTALLKNHI